MEFVALMFLKGDTHLVLVCPPRFNVMRTLIGSLAPSIIDGAFLKTPHAIVCVWGGVIPFILLRDVDRSVDREAARHSLVGSDARHLGCLVETETGYVAEVTGASTLEIGLTRLGLVHDRGLFDGAIIHPSHPLIVQPNARLASNI